jgi:cytochrome o ubiquinol oxidase subunit 3
MSSDSSVAVGPGGSEPAEPEAYEQRAFGFWLFLMGDAILFALLFATYAVMAPNTAGGPEGKDFFSLSNTFAETMLLLFSSITFGFATLSMKAGHRGTLLGWMFVTVVLGLSFVALEFREFSGMIAEGAGPDRSGFLSAFFTLVGMHGLHVSFGLIWILIMASEVVVKGLTVPVVSRLSRLALFWHFLDIIWVAIFSIVYLPGIL